MQTQKSMKIAPWPKNKDSLKNEDDFKNEGDLKKEDNLKTEKDYIWLIF